MFRHLECEGGTEIQLFRYNFPFSQIKSLTLAPGIRKSPHLGAERILFSMASPKNRRRERSGKEL